MLLSCLAGALRPNLAATGTGLSLGRPVDPWAGVPTIERQGLSCMGCVHFRFWICDRCRGI